MRKIWTAFIVFVVTFLFTMASWAADFDGQGDNQLDSLGYYYAITGGKFPNGQTVNGDNASGGTFRFLLDDPAWGYPIQVWNKDDWFPENAGLALTMKNEGTVIFDNFNNDTGDFYTTPAGQASAATPGLYRGYSMSNNYDWIYAGYFKLNEETTIDEIIGYFDENSGLDSNSPHIGYRLNIWSNAEGDLLPAVNSFSGDVFSSENSPGTFLWGDTGVDRVFGDDYGNITDDIFYLSYHLDEPLTLSAGEYWFSHDAIVTTPIVVTPNPVAIGSDIYLSAIVTDNNGHVSSAWYSLNDSLEDEMNILNNPYGYDALADATLNIAEAGVYNICAYGKDSTSEILPEECTMLVVYDPDGGFVTGGGWIDSPEGAYKPQEYPSGNTFFMDNFDSDPTLSDTQAPDSWYPDRYAPAAFESALFDGDNRLHVRIAADDYLPYGSTFYNYQGRKFDLWNGINTYITADLYVGADWENEQRHASIWATTFDADGNISGYPIMGFTADTGFRIYTQDTDQDTSNGYQPGWYDIPAPSGFVYGAWYTLRAELSETAYRYYINGELVWTDAITFDSIEWGNMMLQAYNYGEDYDVYWDNVGAGRIGDFPVGKATFGFVSKYKKGASIPTGNTEFVFKAADLNFHSSSYEWLVVTGSNYAKFKGAGTINNELAPNGEDYKFMVWAGDNEPDTFRIKIWYEDSGNEVDVYDNGMDQIIGGGNIIVHTKKK